MRFLPEPNVSVHIILVFILEFIVLALDYAQSNVSNAQPRTLSTSQSSSTSQMPPPVVEPTYTPSAVDSQQHWRSLASSVPTETAAVGGSQRATATSHVLSSDTVDRLAAGGAMSSSTLQGQPGGPQILPHTLQSLPPNSTASQLAVVPSKNEAYSADSLRVAMTAAQNFGAPKAATELRFPSSSQPNNTNAVSSQISDARGTQVAHAQNQPMTNLYATAHSAVERSPSQQLSAPLQADSGVLAVGLMEAHRSDLPAASALVGQRLQLLIESLGPVLWKRWLSIPPIGGNADYSLSTFHVCLAQFTNGNVCYAADQQLHGLVVPDVGTLYVIVLPPALVSSVYHDEPQLFTLVLKNGILERPVTRPVSSGPVGTDAPLPMAALALSILASNVRGGGDAQCHAPHNDPLPDQTLNGFPNNNGLAIPGGTIPLPVVAESFPSVVNAPNPTPRFQKLVCRLELIDLFSFHPEFDVLSRIIGVNNSHIEYVLNEARHRVDIDLDGVPVNHAPAMERLHITVTALDSESYTIAVETVEDLLQSVCNQFSQFCVSRRKVVAPSLTPGFRRHEYREGPDGHLTYLGHGQQQHCVNIPPYGST